MLQIEDCWKIIYLRSVLGDYGIYLILITPKVGKFYIVTKYV
jgi:hypothetical protein